MRKTTPSLAVLAQQVMLLVLLNITAPSRSFHIIPVSDSIKIKILPSQVEFHNVSQHYPLTWQRRLFSSVPYRHYALSNVSFCLSSGEILLLTGASSSGKSTLLQMILQQERGQAPSQGSVTCSCLDLPNVTAAKPVYLNQPPPLRYDNRRTVETVLRETCSSFGRRRRRQFPQSQQQEQQEIITSALWHYLCQQVSLQVMVPPSLDATAKKPAELSPSENYRLELVRACLESMLSSHSSSRSSSSYDNEDTTTATTVLLLPAPILLLDEWMDTESSVIVQAVQSALQQLAQNLGAVICSVTHKPERWNMAAATTTTNNKNATTTTISHMTLCRGEILSFHQQQPKS